MSASNWRECPKCRMKAERAQRIRLEKAAKNYGKIPQEDWIHQQKHAETEIELDQTLREDYQLGIQDIMFLVSYSASCEKCDFEFKYKWTQPVSIQITPGAV